jgi:hypothetical protein
MNGKSISEKELRPFACPSATGQKIHRLLVFLSLSFFLLSFFLSFFPSFLNTKQVDSSPNASNLGRGTEILHGFPQFTKANAGTVL